jgi:hypothetical protein
MEISAVSKKKFTAETQRTQREQRKELTTDYTDSKDGKRRKSVISCDTGFQPVHGAVRSHF